MKRPSSARGSARRSGYVSLLAITFAFGLATLGSALAVSLRAYLTAAIGREQTILDRISLESAVTQRVGEIAAGKPHPIAPSPVETVTLNRRAISVEASLPEGKFDLAMDDAGVLSDALETKALPNGLAEGADSPGLLGLADVSRRAGLTAGQEDCLRRHFTLGRAPETMEPLAAVGASGDLTRVAAAGDQVDVHARLERGDAEHVLWIRARFTGSEHGQWSVHDSRMLVLRGQRPPC